MDRAVADGDASPASSSKVAGRTGNPATYAATGVDIAAADSAVEKIRALAGGARHAGVVGEIGGFGGLFQLDSRRWKDPVLVAGTDGIGTKAIVAESTGRLDTVGIDLVAMCVDDIVCVGAEPLFFLDYLAVGKVDPDAVAAVVRGVVAGCVMAGCALLGGETAEHPGAMRPAQFDLAGFAVGAVNRAARLGPDLVRPGDVLVGLASPGLRSNGYSLARHVFFDLARRSLDDPAWEGAPHTLADELMRPSTIYARGVLAAITAGNAACAESGGGIHAAAHITGGGIAGNLARVLPPSCDAVVDGSAWAPPEVFGEIARLGQVDVEEMTRVFNCGVGMILVCAPDAAAAARDALADAGIVTFEVGTVVAGNGSVRFDARSVDFGAAASGDSALRSDRVHGGVPGVAPQEGDAASTRPLDGHAGERETGR